MARNQREWVYKREIGKGRGAWRDWNEQENGERMGRTETKNGNNRKRVSKKAEKVGIWEED